ncbi:MAG: hypothetical protein P8I03_07370, partial [Thalassotalea sp.]|nr:hypothetical protein [Thalassotalea sp.]
CESQWKLLKSVQAQLKNNSTESLRSEEHKRHTAYQNCRKKKNNSYAKKESDKRVKTSKKHKNKYNNSHILNKKINKEFVGNRRINIKGFFEGEKQNQWLKYYKKPEYCVSPKSTQVFAKCMNHRETEALKFNEQWIKENLPPSIKLTN